MVDGRTPRESIESAEKVDRAGVLIPTNEMGVMYLFSRYHEALGFEAPVHVGTHCPDGVFLKDGKKVRIEFEYLGINFVRHDHDPSKADLIVCWRNGAKSLPLPSLELARDLFVNGRDPIRKISRVSVFGFLDILPMLYQSGPRTFREIAAACDAGSGTVRINLNHLLRKGWVARRSGGGAPHFAITFDGEKAIVNLIKEWGLLKYALDKQDEEPEPAPEIDAAKIRRYRPISDFEVERIPEHRFVSFLDGRIPFPEYANKDFKWIEVVVKYDGKLPTKIVGVCCDLVSVGPDGKYSVTISPPPVAIGVTEEFKRPTPSPAWIPTSEQLEMVKADVMKWVYGDRKFRRRMP